MEPQSDPLEGRLSTLPVRDVEATKAHADVRSRLFGEPSEQIRIGRFVLLDQIGSGGMGVVYSAYDAELDRRVAIKLMRSDSDARADRLVREAKAMARLSHPSVVTIYEAGTFEGQVFLVMEHVRGMDLRRWIKQADRSWRAALAVLIQAGRGLAAAHAAGLVHRDFKPENVLVAADDGAKVLDFGLARTLDEAEPVHPSVDREIANDSDGTPGSLTRTGAVLGTPAYIAPEHFAGARADELSDQFAFCVTAYESLYGQRPFAGATLFEIVEAAQDGDVRPPPAGTKVPSWLRRVLLQGLSNDPRERHASMDALLARMDTLSSRRRRRWLTAGGLAGIAVLGASALGWGNQADVLCTGAPATWSTAWGSHQHSAIAQAFERSGHALAERNLTHMRNVLDEYGARWMSVHREACEATRLRGERSEQLLDLQMVCLDRRLTEVRALVQLLQEADAEIVGRTATVVTGLPELDICGDLDRLQDVFPPPENPDDRREFERIRADYVGAQWLDRFGRAREAREGLERARDEADELGYRPLQAEIRVDLAGLNQWASEKTVEVLYEAVWLAEAAGDDHAALRAWIYLISREAEVGHFEEGIKASWRAEAALERFADGWVYRNEYHNALGGLYLAKSEYAKSIEHLEKAIEIVKYKWNDEAKELPNLYNNIGNAHSLREDNERAYEYYKEAYRIRVDQVGEKHVSMGQTLLNLGRITARLDDLELSNFWYGEALEVLAEKLADDAPGAALVLNNLGQNYGDMGYYVEAIPPILEAIGMLERKLGPKHRVLIRVRRGLAEIYMDAGDLDKAVAEAKVALEIAHASLGGEHPETAATMRRMAEVWIAAGEHSRARKLLEAALPIIEGSEEAPDQLAHTYYHLARALWVEPKQRARAREHMTRVVELVGEAPRNRKRLHEAERWLATHPAP